MTKRPPSRSAVFIILHAALCLSLLTAAAAAGLQAEWPAVTFRVYGPEPVQGLEYLARPEDTGGTPVVWHTAEASGRLVYRGPQPLVLFRGQAAPEGGGHVRVPAASCRIPEGMREVLLVLVREAAPPAGDAAFRVLCLDDSGAGHPPGTIRLVNLSGWTLSGSHRGMELQLAPGESVVLRPGAKSLLHLGLVWRGRRRTTFHAPVTAGRGGRVTLLLLPPFREGSLEVMPRILCDGCESGGGEAVEPVTVDDDPE